MDDDEAVPREVTFRKRCEIDPAGSAAEALEALSDPEAAIRVEAVHCLSLRPRADYSVPLRPLLDDPDELVRVETIEYFEDNGLEPVRSEILRLAQSDGSPLVRGHAWTALAQWPDDETEALCLDGLKVERQSAIDDEGYNIDDGLDFVVKSLFGALYEATGARPYLYGFLGFLTYADRRWMLAVANSIVHGRVFIQPGHVGIARSFLSDAMPRARFARERETLKRALLALEERPDGGDADAPMPFRPEAGPEAPAPPGALESLVAQAIAAGPDYAVKQALAAGGADARAAGAEALGTWAGQRSKDVLLDVLKGEEADTVRARAFASLYRVTGETPYLYAALSYLTDEEALVRLAGAEVLERAMPSLQPADGEDTGLFLQERIESETDLTVKAVLERALAAMPGKGPVGPCQGSA